MFRKWHFSVHEQVVRKKIESPRRCGRRIQYAHCPSRGIPRIYKDLAANLLLLSVQRFERLPRHHDFAAYFEVQGQFYFLQFHSFHAQRNRPNRLYVRRNVLARRAVAARNTAYQHSILVLQRDAQPRSEEHTSELQSQSNLVCRLLLEKKKNK